MIFAKNFLYVSFTLLILGLQASLSESTLLFQIGQKITKSIKPVQIGCHRDHQITIGKGNNIRGVLAVKSCPSSTFIQKPSLCTSISGALASLVKKGLERRRVSQKCDISIDKVLGDTKQTEFHHSLPCEKSTHAAAIAELKNAVTHPSFHDTLTQAKQPDSKELSCGEEDGKHAVSDHSSHDTLTHAKQLDSKELSSGEEVGKDAASDHSSHDTLTQATQADSKELSCGEEVGKDAASDHFSHDTLTQAKQADSKELSSGQEDGKDAAC
ncbi:unnamed protein product [Rotaria magnacalcarata]